MRMRVPMTAMGFCLVAIAAVADPAAEPELRYFVDVTVPSLDAARSLALAAFDIAGINHDTMKVGVVVSAARLEQLQSMGWPLTLRSTNRDQGAVAALADYVDPQELSVFMDQVAATYPSLAKKITTRETLFEGQKQYTLHITKDVAAPNDRPGFIVDAQHHAR